jgi:dTDP-4-amino-4,6-dideoxygalactose transaminase
VTGPGETPLWSIPLADVRPDSEVLDAVLEVVSSGWWSMGPRVAAFEAAFGGFCGTNDALAVANGTAALQLALAGIGCGPGDEVVLPSLNFVAAANAVVLGGATPVFCDIRGERDLNLDPASLEEKLGPRTKAVVVLHYGGHPCDMDAVLDLCRQRDIRVIEDAAHAIGATHRGRPAGSLADVGCFSLFSNKNLPVGEGGVVVTSDQDLAARLRLLRSHGMTTLTWDRHRGHADTYDVVTPGFNFRMDEIHAAIGLAEMRRLPEWNERRAALVRRYRAELDGRIGVHIAMPEQPGITSAHHLAVAVFESAEVRAAAAAELKKRRIQTSVHYPPIHLFSAYRRPGVSLPRTEAVASRLLTLPLYPHMPDDAVAAVADAIATAAAAPTPGA